MYESLADNWVPGSHPLRSGDADDEEGDEGAAEPAHGVAAQVETESRV